MSSERALAWVSPAPTRPVYVRRIALTSLWLGLVVAILLWAASSGRGALGFGAGAALGIANFLLLAALMGEIVTLEARSRRRIVFLVAIKVALVYGGLALLLASGFVPVISAVAGFSLILAVIVLKALGRVLTGEPSDRRGTR
jgi:hypothetical protein